MGSPAPAEAPAQPGASPRGIQAGGKSHPAQQLLHPASEPLSPAGEGAADAPFQTGALLPSSEEATPAHSGDQGPALSAEEAERRKRRRERWEAEVEAGHRWDLHRRLADISTDVEWLAREVERVRSELEVPLPPISELPEAERTQVGRQGAGQQAGAAAANGACTLQPSLADNHHGAAWGCLPLAASDAGENQPHACPPACSWRRCGGGASTSCWATTARRRWRTSPATRCVGGAAGGRPPLWAARWPHGVRCGTLEQDARGPAAPPGY